MPYALKVTLFIILVLIFVLVITVNIAAAVFNRRADKEAREVLSSTHLVSKEAIQPEDLACLPYCVQRWLERSGVVGKDKIHTVRLTQTGRMRTAESKPWMPFEAVQYINVDKPGFVWKAKVKAAPLVYLTGRDKYYKGHGYMLIKLLALIPVVDAKPGYELDQGAMQRFLAELVWYPTAALNDYIYWEEIDADSARATMTWEGVTASMVFNFNAQGDLLNNVTSRYREVNGSYVLNDWGGVARAYQEYNGIRISNKSDVIWKLETGDFNWLQIKVTDINYNL